MRTTDPPDHAVRTELHDATVDLRDIAATIDRACAVDAPTIDLLEASYAIHRALVVLSDWCDLRERIEVWNPRLCSSRQADVLTSTQREKRA